MVTAVTAVSPVSATGGVTSVTLQPGTVVNAQVLQVMAEDMVRIALANMSLDVMSEVPLQAGQSLQLAVSQTQDGVRLQIVPPGGSGAAAASTATIVDASLASSSSAASSASQLSVARPLSPLEAAAVTQALQTAAAKQGSLSPLFANLPIVAGAAVQAPQPVQQAALALLAMRPALNEQLSGDDVEDAFKASGLFSAQAGASSATPDLKAALVVFRQTLSAWLGEMPVSIPGEAQSVPQAQVQTTGAPPLVPDMQAEETGLSGGAALSKNFQDLDAVLHAAVTAAGKTGAEFPLQEILQSFPRGVQDAVQSLLAQETAQETAQANKTLAGGQPTGEQQAAPHTDLPPPPYRGAFPSPQPIATASIDQHMASDAVVHRLLDETDAALARQTLLQIASLPDQAGQTRADMTPRWNFEIPFVTPQGTAVAQFEISRDGGGNGAESEAESRIWRARFTLDLEPAGPVHAQVSLVGERTSVRMWAERASTAAQLRVEAPKLSQALREAELVPGDIVIGSGTPPQPPAPKNGHFLDRAS